MMGLVQRSFYGGVLILVVIAVRAVLLDKLPKRTFLILWGAALLRLLIPFSLSSAFSVYSVLGQKLEAGQRPEAWQTQSVQKYLGDYMEEGFTIGDFWVQLTEQPVVSKDEKMSDFRNYFSVPWVIWFAGACICAVFFITVYFRCLREFRTALPVEDSIVWGWLENRKLWRTISVRRSDRISAPLTYGIFRPIILLPKKLAFTDYRELEYVLQHEYMHIRYWDAAFKLVLAATLCLHWFNPLVWVMYGLMNRDIEFACDEGVLRQLGEKSKSGYALTLIGMEERQSGVAALYNGFSGNAIERRIKAIMKYRRETVVTMIVGVLLVITVVVIFATSAQKPEAAGAAADIAENGAGTDNADGLMDLPIGNAGILARETEIGTNSSVADLSGKTSGIPGIDSSAGNADSFDADSLADNAGWARETEIGTISSDAGIVSGAAAEMEPWHSMPESVYRKMQGMPDMIEFWKAYLSGDIDTLKQYLAEDFEGDLGLFPDGSYGHNAEKAELQAVKWQETEGEELGDTSMCSLEIWPGEEDSLEYLTICLVKEQDGWKISWYELNAQALH